MPCASYLVENKQVVFALYDQASRAERTALKQTLRALFYLGGEAPDAVPADDPAGGYLMLVLGGRAALRFSVDEDRCVVRIQRARWL